MALEVRVPEWELVIWFRAARGDGGREALGGGIDSPDEAMKFWSSQSFFIRCRAMVGVGGILLNIDSDSVGL